MLISDKGFKYFCLSALSLAKTTDIFFDDYVSKWFKFHTSIFEESEEKVYNIEKERKVGFTTFLAVYVYYYSITNPGATIVIIENLIHIASLLNRIDETISPKNPQIKTPFSSYLLEFNNGCKINTYRPLTYSLTGSQIDLVIFDDVKVKNNEKLLSDIDVALTSSTISKMILCVENDLSKTHSDIKKINLK